MRQLKGKHLNSLLRGLRLVAMESNGIDDDGMEIMGVDASIATLRILKRLGNADHLIRRLQHHWLIMVVVVIRNDRGDYDTQHDFVVAHGHRINDTAEEVQPLLDKIKAPVNQKLIVDWGWIAEILPASAKDPKWDEEKFKDRAEDYLFKFIENRHIEQESVA